MRPALTSTYRIQFNRYFPLSKIKELLSYLKKLGISHIYSSPILQSSRGSNHGYDTINLGFVNPEIGGEEEFVRMSTLVHRNGMGWIQDIVPNHMAMSADNVYLKDIFEKGTHSPYYGLFDLFHSTNFRDKRIDLPILSTYYEKVLLGDRIKIAGNSIEIEGINFPLYSGTLEKENPGSSTLEDIIGSQFFRPLYFKSAISGTNYRRFFSVNSLIALHTEKYFRLIMGKILELEHAHLIDGFRIDHIDGLYDPGKFIMKLRRATHAVIYVEKILTGEEKLETTWRCEGTTGYDFLFHCTYLFVDGEKMEELIGIYRRFTGDMDDPEEMIMKRKYEYMDRYFVSEIDYLADIFLDYVKRRPYGQEINNHIIRNALKDMLTHIPIYRTYTPGKAAFEILIGAIRTARRDSSNDTGLYALERMLGEMESLRLFMRLEQFMPALTAKSTEDNVFFRYVPLISLNEVGCDPMRLSISTDEFHSFNAVRQSRFPNTINTLSTHDTKLGEDLRARISVISEFPEIWESRIYVWNRMNRDGLAQDRPSRKDEYYLYQILLAKDPRGWNETFRRRVEGQLIKAVRESEENTGWIDPDSGYENALLSLLKGAMSNEKFKKDYGVFYDLISLYGSLYSVCENILKMTSPGIPDIYQGSELINEYLTDPDNRAVVDFEKLSAELEETIREHEMGLFDDLLKNIRNGRLKLLVTYILLNLRKKFSAFQGDYTPLEVKGKCRDHIFAFSRHADKHILVVAVPIRIASSSGHLPTGSFWEDTEIIFDSKSEHEFVDVFTREVHKFEHGIPLREIFDKFPFSVLMGGAS